MLLEKAYALHDSMTNAYPEMKEAFPYEHISFYTLVETRGGIEDASLVSLGVEGLMPGHPTWT